MVEELEELLDCLVHVEVQVFGVDQAGEPANSDNAVGPRGPVDPAEGRVGRTVDRAVLHGLQRGVGGIIQNRLGRRRAGQIGLGLAVDDDDVRVPGQQLLRRNLHPGAVAQLQIGHIDGVDQVDDLSVRGPGRGGLQGVLAVAVVNADLFLLRDIQAGDIVKGLLGVGRQGLGLLLHAEELAQEAIDLRRVQQVGADHDHRDTQLLGHGIGIVDAAVMDRGHVQCDGGTGRDDRLVADGVALAEVGQIVVLLQNDALLHVVERIVPAQQQVRGQRIEIDGRGGAGGEDRFDLRRNGHGPARHVGDFPRGGRLFPGVVRLRRILGLLARILGVGRLLGGGLAAGGRRSLALPGAPGEQTQDQQRRQKQRQPLVGVLHWLLTPLFLPNSAAFRLRPPDENPKLTFRTECAILTIELFERFAFENTSVLL